MRPDEFRKHAHRVVDWMADYMENVESYPVKSSVQPGSIAKQLPSGPPQNPGSFDDFMKDLDEIIMPGITHWQNPNFFAYFPANSSPPSVLAEMITATLGAQCMIWETSPAAAELEERMMIWLRDMIGLPVEFEGVIQDSASTATLAAILTAREKATGFESNNEGLGKTGSPVLRIYCSTQTHSSVDKAVKISGIGKKNLVKIAVHDDLSMNADLLAKQIAEDKAKGFLPCCAIASLGTTGTTAVDNLKAIGEVCAANGMWLHVDAAMGGTALILPEFAWMLEGKEYVDSLVFNPHKWMFTNFDCTAYFVKDASTLIKTFEILPEYLKTRTRGKVNDYRDWGVPLGRRFRALKLWSVIRSYGVSGLQEKVRLHVALAAGLAEKIKADNSFEILAPVVMSVVCFRFRPQGVAEDELNNLNEKLNHSLNDTGKLYLSHTVVNGKYTLRMATAQTNVTAAHVDKAWEMIKEHASLLA